MFLERKQARRRTGRAEEEPYQNGGELFLIFFLRKVNVTNWIPIFDF
jgi:hypothetical protein